MPVLRACNHSNGYEAVRVYSGSLAASLSIAVVGNAGNTDARRAPQSTARGRGKQRCHPWRRAGRLCGQRRLQVFFGGTVFPGQRYRVIAKQAVVG